MRWCCPCALLACNAACWGVAKHAPPGEHLRRANFATCACLTLPPRLVHHPLPRPDKNTLDQQLGKSDFVELRRAELERYLRKLAAHPVVGASEVGGWVGGLQQQGAC